MYTIYHNNTWIFNTQWMSRQAYSKLLYLANKDDNSYFLLLLHNIDLMHFFDVALLESCKAMNVHGNSNFRKAIGNWECCLCT